MRILITGATGFIGRALTLRLLGAKHQVTAWVRDETKARSLLGPDVVLAGARGPRSIQDSVAAADAVINLAGEPVFAGRWTPARKRGIADSRLRLTHQIVDAIKHASHRPAVLVSASAVGYYGDRGDQTVEDDAPAGEDFLAKLCRDWEAAALDAQGADARVFIPRIGIVFGADGGALGRMIVPFRMGAGGPIGSGRQFVPWIHIDDLVEMIAGALEDQRYSGPMIASAPNPVTSRDLARAIGKVLHRPAFMPVPGIALKIALGEAAAMLLTGQRVRPLRLERAGFVWRFPSVEAALADILGSHAAEIRSLDASAPQPTAVAGSTYLSRRRPRFMLIEKTTVAAPIEEVFSFFSKPQNLGVMTPSAMHFQILGAMPDEIRRDLIIEYSIRLGPIPLRWRTRIEEWRPPTMFADSQESGPYRCWWHEHHFEGDGNRTRMEDRVYYAPPLGPLGSIANALFVGPALQRIFAFRAQAMRLRFPDKETLA